MQPALAVDLTAVGEADAVVYLSDTAHPTWGRPLTPDEARAIARVLNELADVVEGVAA